MDDEYLSYECLNVIENALIVLPQLPGERDYCLAYSGGIDSQVLLHLLFLLRQQHKIKRLRAVHINHGLSPYAADWQRQCETQCQVWDIPLQTYAVTIPQTAGTSLEAVARDLRYAQLTKEMSDHTCLITAHHQTDQAETLMLQLVRGAGLAGLAAMPSIKPFASGILWRPLLSLTREKIQQHAKQHALHCIEDASNQDLKFDRNFLRHEIFKPLQQRWPSVYATFARSTQHCAEGLQLHDELAAIDLAACMKSIPFETKIPPRNPPYPPFSKEKASFEKEQSSFREQGNFSNRLHIPTWQQLSPARQKNVIRYFLRQKNVKLPSEKKLAELIQQMQLSDRQRCPMLHYDHVVIRRYKGYMYFLLADSINDAALEDYAEEWDLSAPLLLPQGIGALYSVPNAMMSSPQLNVWVRFRRGGERMHPEQRCGSHPLKKLMQEWGIPPWQRARIPLIFCNDQLCIVPGYARALLAQELGLPEVGLNTRLGD